MSCFHLNPIDGCPDCFPPLPTFDEWYLTKYTHTFEYVYEQPHTPPETHRRALSRALRDYVSEMAQRAAK